MKSFTIKSNDSDQRLDKFIKKLGIDMFLFYKTGKIFYKIKKLK